MSRKKYSKIHEINMSQSFFQYLYYLEYLRYGNGIEMS